MACFFRRQKTQQLEKCIVKEPFMLREWGDRKGGAGVVLSAGRNYKNNDPGR
jgi:hypothetical protein